MLGADRKLTTAKPNYWQLGWLKQHDRLMEAVLNRIQENSLSAVAIGRNSDSGRLARGSKPCLR